MIKGKDLIFSLDMGIFGSSKMSIKCGKCGHKNYIYKYETVSCEKCGATIKGPDAK